MESIRMGNDSYYPYYSYYYYYYYYYLTCLGV